MTTVKFLYWRGSPKFINIYLSIDYLLFVCVFIHVSIHSFIHLFHRRWGFYGFVKDLFTAPDDVMRYLCQNYHIHDIPLGNDWTEKNADKVGV